MNKYNHQLIATLLSFIVFSQAQAMDNSDQPESQSPKFAMENYFPVFICLFDNFDSRHVHVGSVCKIWNQYTKKRLKYFYDFSKRYFDNTREEDKKEKYKDICIKYGEMYNYIYDIYLEKKDLIESHTNEISSDVVYKNILKILGA